MREEIRVPSIAFPMALACWVNEEKIKSRYVGSDIKTRLKGTVSSEMVVMGVIVSQPDQRRLTRNCYLFGGPCGLKKFFN